MEPKSKVTVKLNSETMLSKKKLSFEYYRVLLICKYKDEPLVFYKHMSFLPEKYFLVAFTNMEHLFSFHR